MDRFGLKICQEEIRQDQVPIIRSGLTGEIFHIPIIGLYQPAKLIKKGNYFYCLTSHTHGNFGEGAWYNYHITKSVDLLNDKKIIFATFQKSTHLLTTYTLSNSFFNKAHLMKVNSDSTLSILDSCITDSEGMFSFNTKQDSLFLKIIPNANIFPEYIPTYYNSVFTIQQAYAFRFATKRFDPIEYALILKDLASLGGALKISGNIYTETSNNLIVPYRISASSIVKNLNLILVNANEKPVLQTTTNDQGYFEFQNLQPGTYKIFVDYPYIKNSLAPAYTLNSSQTELEFVL